MTPDRLDALLEEALVTGRIPAEATPEERAEIESLLRGAGAARGLHAQVDAEARASQPTARARFQRHLAAETAKATPVPCPVVAAEPRPGFFGRLFALNRGLALAGSAVAIGLLVVVATVVSQSYNGVETASAQVLEEDDYAQVQGVVSGTSGEGTSRKVTIESDFGPVEVALANLTAVDSSEKPVDPSSLKAGDPVTVAGTVQRANGVTSMTASSLALLNTNTTNPDKPKVRELRNLKSPLEGRITVVTVSRDGAQARILVDPGNGEHILVRVAPASLATLLDGQVSPVGQRVRVTQEANNAPGEFTVVFVTGQTPPSSARPALAPIRGVLVSRQLNILSVQTDRGLISVVVRPETRINVAPNSGLTVRSVREGETAIGHAVSVQGGIERATGRFIAEVIWVGPKAPN